MSSKLVDVDADLVYEASDYYTVKTEDDTFETEAPRINLSKEYVEKNDDGTFTMPEWYATRKGLV